MQAEKHLSEDVRIPALREFLAFEAVARLGSFSRAADELSVTQSAISHRIRQLESHVSAPLLLRVGHNVTLTSKGRELLPYVLDGLASLKQGIAIVSTSHKSAIKLSLAPAIASNWLIQRLAAFQRLNPEADLEIIVTSKMLNLPLGEADIGIRFGAGVWEGLDSIKLIPVKILAVCSPAYQKAHPWLKNPADLQRATLLRHNFIYWRPWFVAAGVDLPEPEVGPLFSEVSLLLDAAEFSQGVALCFDVLVERPLSNGALVKLFDLEIDSERSYYIVTPKNRVISHETEKLMGWLLESAGDSSIE